MQGGVCANDLARAAVQTYVQHMSKFCDRDHYPESTLNDAQIADLRARLAEPGPSASDDEVEAFFARLSA